MMRFTTSQSVTHSASSQGPHRPNRWRNATAENSECAAKRTRSGAFAAFIQNPRSARRDHDLAPFASNRIADAVAVGLNAPTQTLRVSPLASPATPKVSLAGSPCGHERFLTQRRASASVAVAERCANILDFEVWVVLEDLLLVHSTGDHADDRCNGNSQSA